MYRFVIFIFIISLLGCASNKNNVNIEAIKMENQLPIKVDDDYRILRDSIKIYYYNDKVIYMEPYTFQVYSKNSIKGDSILFTPENIESEGVKFYYVVHRIGDSVALRYDSIGAEATKIDSIKLNKFLMDNAHTQVPFDKFITEYDVLIESFYNKKEKVLRDTYITPIKKDDTYPDTSFFYYSELLNDVKKFSFSKKLDLDRGKKFYKIEMIYNIKNDRDGSVKRSVFKFEFEKLKQQNFDDIIYLYNRFEKDSHILK